MFDKRINESFSEIYGKSNYSNQKQCNNRKKQQEVPIFYHKKTIFPQIRISRKLILHYLKEIIWFQGRKTNTIEAF